MIKLDQIKVLPDYKYENLVKICAKSLKIDQKFIKNIKILKKSIDARRKPNVYFVLSLGVELEDKYENKFENLKIKQEDLSLRYDKVFSSQRPVVVGFGPSGMFAALALARMGLKPIVIEQGKRVDEREKDVLAFWNERKLNKYSNVQFGEGGAGTFSDGKLNTNVNNILCKKVIYELYTHGAPEEILYNSKPHIGSDKLKEVVKKFRAEILSLGGEIKFSCKFVDFSKTNDGVLVQYNDLTQNKIKTLTTSHLLLCLGHSARDTFKMLYKNNVKIEQKPFAIGVRIEQLQEDINLSQYGSGYSKGLPSADYKLVAHLPNGRSIFTFCMCPGGKVVASSSNEGEIVTNGMSDFARDGLNANSALLVNVNTDDYKSSHPLAGLEFQEKYEKLAFEVGGANYNAPAQTVGQFLGKHNTNSILSTYRPSLTMTQIEKCLPSFVSESLKMGIPILNQKMKNFAKDEDLLIAIESRSSCPITIVRDDNLQSNISGIYPVGEGAGYAGGITTSAQDGIKVAEKIYEQLKNKQ